MIKAQLNGLVRKVRANWWPFLHGAVGNSLSSRIMREELARGIVPGTLDVETFLMMEGKS